MRLYIKPKAYASCTGSGNNSLTKVEISIDKLKFTIEGFKLNSDGVKKEIQHTYGENDVELIEKDILIMFVAVLNGHKVQQ